MADPIIPGLVRAQVVLEGDSGLPEDRFVTTYVFGNQDGGSPSGSQLDDLADLLVSFWTQDPVGGTGQLQTYLGAQCSGDAQVKLYRLGDAPPREPTTYDFTVSGFSQSSGLPAEVALCISYYATRNIPRRRGRIYLGPLSNLSGQFAAGDWRPVDLLRQVAALKARDLISASNNLLLPWAVLSQVDGVARPITDGWVDNSWDTQRRRGIAPTLRETFS